MGWRAAARRRGLPFNESKQGLLTGRVEGSRINCRAIGTAWLCGVHDGGGGDDERKATCREIVGLTSSRLEEGARQA